MLTQTIERFSISFEDLSNAMTVNAADAIAVGIGQIEHRIDWLQEEVELNSFTFGGQLARRIERLSQIHKLLVNGPEWWPNNDSSMACSAALGTVKVLCAIDLINYLLDEVKKETDLDEHTMHQSVRELEVFKTVLLHGCDDPSYLE